MYVESEFSQYFRFDFINDFMHDKWFWKTDGITDANFVHHFNLKKKNKIS